MQAHEVSLCRGDLRSRCFGRGDAEDGRLAHGRRLHLDHYLSPDEVTHAGDRVPGLGDNPPGL